eukprot:GEMP01002623.1.p1 GENE.GEMP01002623.1~~GEMP01002623.1.p1  ORF type:complete len:832 (+),score=115.31 GEMP01002623.1:425-2920(+)
MPAAVKTKSNPLKSRRLHKERENSNDSLLSQHVPAPPAPAPPPPEPLKPPGWAFGGWAHFATIISSIFGLLYSLAGIVWSLRPMQGEKDHGMGGVPIQMYPTFHTTMHLYINVYACGLSGLLILSHVLIPPLKRSGPRVVIFIRAATIFFLSAPLHFTNFTMFQAWCLIVIAGLYTLSGIRGEQGNIVMSDGKVHGRQWTTLGEGGIGAWIRKQHARQSIARVIVICLWLGINAGLFYHKYFWAKDVLVAILANPADFPCWTNENVKFTDECMKLVDQYDVWFPIAKGNGLCLDFNCALIVLLINQGIIRRAHEWNQNGGIMFYIFGWMPINKTILFHKYLAFAIFVQVCGHSLGHFMCLSYTLPVWTRTGPNGLLFNATNSTVTLSIWATGFLLLFVLVFMFAVAMEPCRKVMFEAFMYTHRIGTGIWMVCLFWHSTVFWMFGTIPCILYLIDHSKRSYAAKTARSQLIAVRFTPPVMELIFCSPISYKVGQYVFLHCPWVSKFQGHPFTISSTPETGTLTLHIKVWPGGWTEHTKNFLLKLINECDTHGEGRREETTVADGFAYTFGSHDRLRRQFMKGKHQWKGIPIFRIDGPHSAPAVHFGAYESIVVASAGIGLTPLHAILRCLTEFAWALKPDATVVQTRNLYAVWLIPHKDISAFRWFMDSVSKAELAIQTLPEEVAGKVHYELHLFVTSFKREEGTSSKFKKPKKKWMRIADDEKIVRPYTPEQLENIMDNPSVESSQFAEVMDMRKERRQNCMGNTHVWNGRPKWDDLYKRVKTRHHSIPGEAAHKVGVFFCGTTMIARDLQMSSMRISDSTCVFKVMKENF